MSINTLNTTFRFAISRRKILYQRFLVFASMYRHSITVVVPPAPETLAFKSSFISSEAQSATRPTIDGSEKA